MFEMVDLLAGTSLFLLAFSVLIFDIPRYTFSLVSLALFGVRRRNDRGAASNASVSVIIPTARPTKRAPSRSGLARWAWWTWSSAMARGAAAARQSTLRPGLPAATCF